MAKNEPRPIFFATPNEFRSWLEKNHAQAREQWIGFHRKSTGRASMSWPESLDEALCFGWIDGLRKSIDDKRYMIRFTPRKTTSTWSAVNVGRVASLTSDGRMQPAGAAAFQNRKEAKSGIYAYEQREVDALEPGAEKQFRANAKAWKYFQARPASYRKTAIWRVVSGKKAETRQKRLEILIADCEAQRPIRELRPRDSAA